MTDGVRRETDDAASRPHLASIDVPPGKVACVVTSLEMLACPPLRRENGKPTWQLKRAACPELSWYRDLFARVGSEWLWSSRLRLSDDELGRVLNAADVRVYAAQDASGDIGLLELDFREAGTCELAFFGLCLRMSEEERDAGS